MYCLMEINEWMNENRAAQQFTNKIFVSNSEQNLTFSKNTVPFLLIPFWDPVEITKLS